MIKRIYFDFRPSDGHYNTWTVGEDGVTEIVWDAVHGISIYWVYFGKNKCQTLFNVKKSDEEFY